MRNSCFSLKVGLSLLSFQFQATFYSERLSRASLKCNIWKGFTNYCHVSLLTVSFLFGVLWFILDLMQGIPVTEDLYSIFTKEKEHEALHKENLRSHQELISQLLQSYMKLLLPDDEKFHGGWALIDCDPRFVEQS